MARRIPIGAVVAAAAVALPVAGTSTAQAKSRACGTKTLYGHTLSIHVVGRPIPCSQVRRIIRGSCHDRKTWSCFSFQPPSPLLVWFKSKERFTLHWSTAIEARRYRCRDARVTPAAWAAARRFSLRAFPTRLQVLSDDLLRCKQLHGMAYPDVITLLGQPDEQFAEKRVTYFRWTIGLERDSFFQIDDELLTLTFDQQGKLRTAKLQQS